MDKLKKTIKGLECLAGMNTMKSNPCVNCGYRECQTYAICIEEVAADALSLLKEQEVEISTTNSRLFNPIIIEHPFGDDEIRWR